MSDIDAKLSNYGHRLADYIMEMIDNPKTVILTEGEIVALFEGMCKNRAFDLLVTNHKAMVEASENRGEEFDKLKVAVELKDEFIDKLLRRFGSSY